MTRSRITVTIIVLIALVLALWINIPNLIGLLMSAALKDMGATHVSIKVSDVNWQQSHIQHLRFYKTFAQRELQVDANNVSIKYSLSGLINGQIKDLNLPETNIVVTPAVESPNDDNGLELPALLLPDATQSPVTKLRINKLTLIHQHSDKRQAQVEISGMFEKKQQAVRGRLVFQQQGQQDLEVNLGMHKHLINLEVGYVNSPPWININVQEVVSTTEIEQLQMKSRIDLAKLTQLVQAWGYARELTGVAGDIHSQIQWPIITSNASEQVSEQDKLNPSIKAELQLSIDDWKGYASNIVAHLSWQATMTKDSVQWALSKNSFLRTQPDINSMSNNNAMLRDIMAGQEESRLHIDFPSGLSGKLSLDKIENITINEAIRFNYQHQASKPLFKGSLDALSLQLQPEMNIQTRFTTLLNLRKTGIPSLRSLNSIMAGHVNISPQALTLSIDKNATATVVPAKQPTFDLAPVHLKIAKRAECQLIFESSSTTCKQLAMAYDGLKYLQGDEQVSADSAYLTLNNVRLKNDEISFKADLVVKGINAQNPEYSVKLGQLKSKIAKTANKLRINGELLTLDGDIKTQYAVDYYSENGKGILEYELSPIDFAKQKQIPARLFSKGRLPVKLLSGSLASHGRIKWEPVKVNKNKPSEDLHVAKQIYISLDNLAGSYQKSGFIGLQSEINLAGIDTLSTTEPVRLQLHKLDAGLVITDINMSTDFKFKNAGVPVMQIHTLNAKILGGEINGQSISIDLERSHNPFVLEINGIDLSKLLAWQQVEGISGTGRLDVRLPFDLTKKGLSMKEGQIVALSPGGKLRYIPDERVKSMAQSNDNLKMLLNALNNFIYSELTAKSNYSPDGKLELNVALSGKNPEFQQGKVINLNINIEENLLKLFKSLQLGDEISKKIADQLQQQK